MQTYRKKNLAATLRADEINGKLIYIVTTQNAAKTFKTINAAETYLLKKGYARV